jgi:L-lactate permease
MGVMTERHMAIVAVIFGIAYALSAALRGDVLPGIVTGILGGVLVFLVLKRVAAHNASVRRRRERQE